MTTEYENRKLLIVDDEEPQRKKVSALANNYGLEVILANNTSEGISKALSEQPQVIITDKDMPDGTGNDVALNVRQVYSPVIIGMTGGNPDDFKEELFDLRLHKSISDQDYSCLIRKISESKNLEKDFQKGLFYFDTNQLLKNVFDIYLPLDILVQGYTLIHDLQNEQSADKQLLNLLEKKPSLKDANDLFNAEFLSGIYKLHLKTQETFCDDSYVSNLYDIISKVKLFVEDPAVTSFIKDVSEKRIEDIAIKQEFRIYHDRFVEVCNAYLK